MTPKGQHLFEIYTTLSYVRVASYTSHTLPCLNTKQVAVKVSSKDQQPLIIYKKLTVKFKQPKCRSVIICHFLTDNREVNRWLDHCLNFRSDSMAAQQ